MILVRDGIYRSPCAEVRTAVASIKGAVAIYTSELSEWCNLGYPLSPGDATLNVLISLCFLNTNGTSFLSP